MGDVSDIKDKINLHERLQARRTVPPEVYDEVSSLLLSSMFLTLDDHIPYARRHHGTVRTDMHENLLRSKDVSPARKGTSTKELHATRRPRDDRQGDVLSHRHRRHVSTVVRGQGLDDHSPHANITLFRAIEDGKEPLLLHLTASLAISWN